MGILSPLTPKVPPPSSAPKPVITRAYGKSFDLTKDADKDAFDKLQAQEARGEIDIAGNPVQKKAATPDTPPAAGDPAVIAAQRRTEQRSAASRSRRSTILTDEQGLLSAASGNKKTLLGV